MTLKPDPARTFVKYNISKLVFYIQMQRKKKKKNQIETNRELQTTKCKKLTEHVNLHMVRLQMQLLCC